MNWEAVRIIGALTLILGLILIVPGIFLGRWIARRRRGTSLAMRITRTGCAVYGIQVLILVVGCIFLENARHSWSAGATVQSLVFPAYILFMTGVFNFVDKRLTRYGIVLMRPADDLTSAEGKQ